MTNWEVTNKGSKTGLNKVEAMRKDGRLYSVVTKHQSAQAYCDGHQIGRFGTSLSARGACEAFQPGITTNLWGQLVGAETDAPWIAKR